MDQQYLPSGIIQDYCLKIQQQKVQPHLCEVAQSIPNTRSVSPEYPRYADRREHEGGTNGSTEANTFAEYPQYAEYSQYADQREHQREHCKEGSTKEAPTGASK